MGGSKNSYPRRPSVDVFAVMISACVLEHGDAVLETQIFEGNEGRVLRVWDSLTVQSANRRGSKWSSCLP